MTAVKWHQGPLVGFDLESTGKDPHTARIVTAAAVVHRPGQRPSITQWLIDPGVDIPDEAAAVHGWTTQALRTRLNGHQALRIDANVERPLTKDGALFEIATKPAFAFGNDVPLVGANVPYDLTLTEAELARNGIDTLASRPAGIRGVVDVQVIEKQYDKFRKQCYKAPGCRPDEQHHECGGCRGGKTKCGGCGITDRKLTSLCKHYGVRHTGAHDAAGDALAAIRLAVRLAADWPEIGRLTLPTLHRKQVEWRRDHMLGLRAFMDKVGKEHDGCCPEWPVHERCAPAKAVA